MAVLMLSRNINFRFDAVPAHFSAVRFKATALACSVGMLGAALVILVLTLAKMAGLTTYSALMDPAGGHTLAMRAAPLLWGGAFLGIHIVFLRAVGDAFWRSPLGVMIFTSLALSVSLLFATLSLTILGLGFLAAVIVLMMLSGFTITAIGLVVWVAWTISRTGHTSLTDM